MTITIQKQLAGVEDILFGQGQVNQDRGGTSYPITKLNASNLPYSGDVDTSNFVSLYDKVTQLSTAATTSISNTTAGTASSQQLQVDTAALRSVVFDIVGAYINEVTAALSPLAKLSGFGVSFGTADGTVVSTTGGFGYDFGNFFGTYSTNVSATPITVTPVNRGAAAAYYFAQV